MPDPKRDCPKCHQRIHPLDLSDLYRGRKLNCAHCGSGLHVGVAWWLMVPVGTLLAVLLAHFGHSLGLSDSGGYGLLVASAVLATWANFGLRVEGAPWVKLSAREQPWPKRNSLLGFMGFKADQ